MQLDADEDGEPFFKPPVLAPTPNPFLAPLDQQEQQQQQQQQEGEPQQQQQQQQQQQRSNQGSPIVEPGGPRQVSEQAAAALATIEQEE